MAAVLLLLSSLGAMALRDHLGWLADAERAPSWPASRAVVRARDAVGRRGAHDRARRRRRAAACSRRASAASATSGSALSLAPEIVALAAHGWPWIEEYERGVQMLDRLVAAGRETSSVGALP